MLLVYGFVALLAVAGVSAGGHGDKPFHNITTTTTTSKGSTITANCSGTTTLDLMSPTVTIFTTEFFTVSLAPGEHFYPTWSNPLPFCVTITKSALRVNSTTATPLALFPPKSVVTSTAIATRKNPVTVITTPSPPPFEQPPKPSAPQESPKPPSPQESPQSPQPPPAPPVVSPVITSLPFAPPPVATATTVVINGVTLTLKPTTTGVQQPTAPAFTGGATKLRKDLGTWAALGVGLFVAI
ncbi:MAG: hypothetical protein M1813_008996 [Trichoglossum hirsutum]|nr:MAG: hypothetical protein M1813_008996 [Trichoglossum hirsutum]